MGADSRVDDLSFTLVAHAPERRRSRSSTPSQAGQCCCCCCCLHSIGSLAGSLLAPRWKTPRGPLTQEEKDFGDNLPKQLMQGESHGRFARDLEEPAEATPIEALPRARRSALALYWWTVVLLIPVIVVFPQADNLLNGQALDDIGTMFIVGVFYILMFWPLVQLAAAIPPAIILALSRRGDRTFQLKQVGRITLGVLIGGTAGLLIMLTPCILSWALK